MHVSEPGPVLLDAAAPDEKTAHAMMAARAQRRPPTFLCRFLPCPGWEAVRTRFDAWSALHGPESDGSRTVHAIQPVMALGRALVPVGGGPPMGLFKECVLRIDGGTARLRR
ncbi:DUF6207 family protein [Streptomyces syringium]|uniref:DUF6207 family protein n=1 Tax=Streptomyces syringium TaxID=76729 RepID=UPI0033FB5705